MREVQAGDRYNPHTDLDPEISHLGQQVPEQRSVCGRQLGGQHHPDVIAPGRSHHVREHEHAVVALQHRRVGGHEGVEPVTHLQDTQRVGTGSVVGITS